MSDGPLIVQSDRTVLLEVAHPAAEDARHDLAVFAELERAPEHIHTYRITRLGLWNARAAGHTAEDMLGTLEKYSKFPIPQTVTVDVSETVARYGRLVIERDDEGTLLLRSADRPVLLEVATAKRIAPLLVERRDETTFTVEAWARGQLKQELVKLGWPAAGRCATTSAKRSPTSSTAALASSCCRAAPARPWSAPARWRRPRPRRSSS